MLKKYLLLLFFAFGCILTLPGTILPGNMHPAGNSIAVPLPAGIWHCRIFDFDGKLLREIPDARETLALGVLPIGYYRIELNNGAQQELLSAGVIPPPDTTPVPPTTPLAVDSALFYVFFTAERGRLAIDYTMNDVISMLRLASVGYARERLWWREFETFSGDDLISRLNRAYRSAGIPVMTSLYGVPQALAWPKTL